jgi:hypothetical protein
MHPPRIFSTFLVISGVHAGKTPYNTEHLKGFYTERICGTVFTDRCSQISTRIVCGQDYCAQLAPYHAVLDMKGNKQVGIQFQAGILFHDKIGEPGGRT